MIDRVEIQDEIRQYANDLIIDQIGEVEIAMFIRKAKNIVEYSFEDYVNEQYHMYIDRVIPEKKSEYSNYTYGYVSQMRKWVKENGISLNPVELNDPKQTVESVGNMNKSNSTYAKIAVGGTALATGIFLLPKVVTLPAWIVAFSPIAAIAIELLAIGLAYRAYKKDIMACSSINGQKKVIKELESDLVLLKERLIHLTWEQLDFWLDMAVKESDSIINKYICR